MRLVGVLALVAALGGCAQHGDAQPDAGPDPFHNACAHIDFRSMLPVHAESHADCAGNVGCTKQPFNPRCGFSCLVCADDRCSEETDRLCP